MTLLTVYCQETLPFLKSTETMFVDPAFLSTYVPITEVAFLKGLASQRLKLWSVFTTVPSQSNRMKLLVSAHEYILC